MNTKKITDSEERKKLKRRVGPAVMAASRLSSRLRPTRRQAGLKAGSPARLSAPHDPSQIA
jgi:hypothetical protein